MIKPQAGSGRGCGCGASGAITVRTRIIVPSGRLPCREPAKRVARRLLSLRLEHAGQGGSEASSAPYMATAKRAVFRSRTASDE